MGKKEREVDGMSFIYSKLEVEKRRKGEGIEREVREREREKK